MTLVVIAAFIGVWVNVVRPGGMVFGTLNSSAAMLVLVISMMKWLKLVRCMCSCNKKVEGEACCK